MEAYPRNRRKRQLDRISRRIAQFVTHRTRLTEAEAQLYLQRAIHSIDQAALILETADQRAIVK